jgi:hypothetical protein
MAPPDRVIPAAEKRVLPLHRAEILAVRAANGKIKDVTPSNVWTRKEDEFIIGA